MSYIATSSDYVVSKIYNNKSNLNIFCKFHQLTNLSYYSYDMLNLFVLFFLS